MSKTILKSFNYRFTNAMAGPFSDTCYTYHKGKLLYYNKSILLKIGLDAKMEKIEKAIIHDISKNNNTYWKIITPSQNEWDVFLNTLDELDVWSWKEDYCTDDLIMDGGGSNLQIVTNKNKLYTNMFYDFPDNFFEFSEAFDKLIKEQEEI
jgi:hypothetical protein